ncbi:MAG: tyrosine-type recombinase/integrase, partial [Bryobacteraceae bacterium]
EGSQGDMIYKRGKHWHMDAMVNGVRYREALNTTDKREAIALEKKRVGEIQQGKAVSKLGREFARMPFSEAADQFLEERKPHVAERTLQLERNLLIPLRRFFQDRAVMRIRAEEIAAYQRIRRETEIAGRTLNMEVGVLRRIMKRAKVWSIVSEDVKLDRENTRPVARVLTEGQKKLLFDTAASQIEWLVAYCAAVLAVNTTCRGIELKHLRWRDVDLFDRSIVIRRSKTEAGHRPIPLNSDAMAALSHLWRRAEALGSANPDHFVFPACQRLQIEPTRPQKTWRTAWRSLVEETATRAGKEAARLAAESDGNIEEARKQAMLPFINQAGARLRFHDLRHQAITELAEAGASDATIEALAGHMSREMLEHYSHVRMAAKRVALEKLSVGLIKPVSEEQKPASETGSSSLMAQALTTA